MYTYSPLIFLLNTLRKLYLDQTFLVVRSKLLNIWPLFLAELSSSKLVGFLAGTCLLSINFEQIFNRGEVRALQSTSKTSLEHDATANMLEIGGLKASTALLQIYTSCHCGQIAQCLSDHKTFLRSAFGFSMWITAKLNFKIFFLVCTLSLWW